MVLFDSEYACSRALQYSIGLAKRTDAALVLLVILPFEVSVNIPNGIESVIKLGVQVKDTLKRHVDTIQNLDIPAEAAVRIGNPRSELVKFLAESGRVQTIVWGGQPDPIKRNAYWLADIKDIVNCAVVVPFMKAEAEV